MTCDIHAWRPLAGERGVYACECGTLGYRRSDGLIVTYRSQRRRPSQPTVRERTTGSGGAVPALPRLDQLERWTR